MTEESKIKLPGVKYLFPYTDKELKRAEYVYKTYGLSPGNYSDMLEAQEYVCAICQGIDENKFLAVDHCHETGKVRGLLCLKCNTGLGYFRDNVYSLKKAAKYLEKFRHPEFY